MWTMLSAVQLVRRLQPEIRHLGYHITLGGGVLNTGKSDKDLDLFILRKNNTERTAPVECLRTIMRCLPGSTTRALRDTPDYGPDADFHFTEAHLVKLETGERIDVFVQ